VGVGYGVTELQEQLEALGDRELVVVGIGLDRLALERVPHRADRRGLVPLRRRRSRIDAGCRLRRVVRA
jgi:hypothetical protein